MTAPTDWSCCGSSYKCGYGEGDCDGDSDCIDGLKCGTDNCVWWNSAVDSGLDCCE